MRLVDWDKVSCVGLVHFDVNFRTESPNLYTTGSFTCYYCVDSRHGAEFKLHWLSGHI